MRGCLSLNTAKPTKQSSKLLKNLPEQVAAIRQAHPARHLELWSTDEHRIGLKPILRRVWARKGTAVRAVVTPCSQWMYVYAFVHPESGRSTWLLLPTVNVEAFAQALTNWSSFKWSAAATCKRTHNSFMLTPASIGGLF